MFLSAFASLRSDPVSRAYYQRKRDQGETPWARPSCPGPPPDPDPARHDPQRRPCDPQPATKLPVATGHAT